MQHDVSPCWASHMYVIVPWYVLNSISDCSLLTTFNPHNFVSVPATTVILLPVPVFASAFPSDRKVCLVIFLDGFFCHPGLC